MERSGSGRASPLLTGLVLQELSYTSFGTRFSWEASDMQNKLGRAVSVLLVAILSTGSLASAIGSGPTPSTPNPIKQCLEQSKNSRLAALFNLDESSSLKKSDPENRRVDAMKTAMAALAANLRGLDKDSTSNNIDIATSGFAKKFDTHGHVWSALTSQTISSLLDEADAYAGRNETPYTDYEAALEGAEKMFVEYDRAHPDTQNCKVLVWFSDGNLDVDNSSGNQKPEQRKRDEICKKESGVVDRLRGQDVFIVGLGLQAEGVPTNFDLMSKITEGGCGTRPGLGAFTEVESADALIQEMFKNLFGSTNDPLQPCSDQPDNDNCKEVVFGVRPPLDRINALVSITNTIDKASVITPGNSSVVFATGGVMQEKRESFLTSTPSFELSTILGLQVSSLAGQWRIRFEGPGAKYASVFSVFFSDVSVKVDGTPLERDKKKLAPIMVSIGKTDLSGLDAGSSVVDFDVPPTVRAELVANGINRSIPATETSPGSGQFSLSLDSNAAKDLPGLVTLRITPEASISGHKIEFSATSVPLTLRLGDGFPIIKGLTVTNIDGKGASILSISLGGPEEGKGTATIVQDSLETEEVPAGYDDVNASLSTDSSSTKTLTPNVSGVITAKLSPGFAANGKFSGSIDVLLRNAQGEEQTSRLSFTFNMTKPFNTGDFLLILIILLGVFAFVQGAIFFAAADRLSRIGKVPDGTWYARFDILVKEDDSVLVEYPSTWDEIVKYHAQPVDAGQVSRKREAKFESFRFFGTRRQGLLSLMRAGDTSIMVESGGAVMVTTGAHRSSEPFTGRVRPTLAGEWAAAISGDTAKRVAEDAAGVGPSEPPVEDDLYKREFGGGFDAPASTIRPEIRASVIYFFKDFNPALPEDLGVSVEETLQYARIRDAVAAIGTGLLAPPADTDESKPSKTSKRRRKVTESASKPAEVTTRTKDSARDMYG